MTTPSPGQTIHHDPSDNTHAYDADVLAGPPIRLRVKYVNTYDGEVAEVIHEYDEGASETWVRGSGLGQWRRAYIPASPPTNPPSGAYIVAELTSTNPPTWTERESGTYTTSAT